MLRVTKKAKLNLWGQSLKTAEQKISVSSCFSNVPEVSHPNQRSRASQKKCLQNPKKTSWFSLSKTLKIPASNPCFLSLLEILLCLGALDSCFPLTFRPYSAQWRPSAKGIWPGTDARKVTQALFTCWWQGCAQGARNRRFPSTC